MWNQHELTTKKLRLNLENSGLEVQTGALWRGQNGNDTMTISCGKAKVTANDTGIYRHICVRYPLQTRTFAELRMQRPSLIYNIVHEARRASSSIGNLQEKI